MRATLEDREVVICAVPSHGVREVHEDGPGGSATTRPATGASELALARGHALAEMPISETVRTLLAGDLGPKEGMEFLISRQLRSENE